MLPHNNPNPPKWYFSTWGVTVLLIIFGPFAFPFLWKSVSFSRTVKIVLTAVFTLVTVLLTKHTADLVGLVLDRYREAGLIS